MNTTEASIEVTHSKDKKLVSVSVSLPVWIKESEHGNWKVELPLLGIETIAKSELDAETAIDEAITLFCIVAQQFGQGLAKELEALGWHRVDRKNGEPIQGFTLSSDTADALLDRLLQTGESYAKEHIEIANA